MNLAMNPKTPKQATNTKPIPHIPLPFEEVMKDVLKVKPPERSNRQAKREKQSPKQA